MYNSGLSPVSIDGERFFYTNLLRFYGKDHTLLSNDEYERWHTYKCYCCPTQVARSTAWMKDWAYSFSEDGVWVNLYSGNQVEKTFENGASLKIEVVTNYPWDGSVLLRVDEVPAATYAIHLRIPEWAKGTAIKVNGSPYDGQINPGSYLRLEREWASGDRIEVDFPMEVRLVRSHPLVVENRNHVALMRGPLVYCLEEVDLPEGVKVSEIYFPSDLQVQANYAADKLGGATILELEAKRVIESDLPETLYSKYRTSKKENVKINMIPYYAWANRGISEMAVWIPIF